jgi:gas vesicle protein
MNWTAKKKWAAKKWEARSKKTHRFGVSWKFFAGMGIGAAIGMLIAPKSGAELRDDLEDLALDSFEQGRERLQATVEPLVDSVSESVEEVSARAARIHKDVARKAADLKEQVLHSGLLAILNEWPHERLIEIDGIGPVLASKIIQHRPYESEAALLSAKYLPPSAIESLRKAA